jgi:cyclopropane-fatty-acyl-phospholipid synthase
MRVLDIGCGWGGLSRAIARLTGAEVHGITISSNQFAYAERRRAEINEPDLRARLHYEEVDYRRHRRGERAQYDRIVSVGMLEHVGSWHFGTYFRTIRRLLKPDGLALVHSIVGPRAGPTAQWIARDVFPGGYIPCEAEIRAALPKAGLVLEAAHRHPGWHYRRTLECWDERFANRWREEMGSSAEGRRVFRHWRMYFAACQNAFEAAQIGLEVVQFVLRPV